MRNDFYTAYEARMNERYRTHVEQRYATFVDLISALITSNKIVEQGQAIAELGCGAGNISRILAIRHPKVEHILVDFDRRMLQLASDNMQGTQAKFQLHLKNILETCGILCLPKVGLVHSHGVLEHFSDEEIRTILFNQLRLSNFLVHYVPSYKYEKPSFGDERLLTPWDWQAICNPDEIVEFNDGYDLALIFRGPK